MYTRIYFKFTIVLYFCKTIYSLYTTTDIIDNEYTTDIQRDIYTVLNETHKNTLNQTKLLSTHEQNEQKQPNEQILIIHREHHKQTTPIPLQNLNENNTTTGNYTNIDRVCREFLKNNNICTHVVDFLKLIDEEKYFTIGVDITYIFLLYTPGIVVLQFLLLMVFNTIFLLICSIIKPLRNFLLFRLIKDYNTRYFFADNNDRELKIIDRNNKK